MFFYLWIDDDRRQLAGAWAQSVGLCIGLIFVSKLVLHVYGRAELGPSRLFSPSGHVAIATSFYGNLAILLARGRSRSFGIVLFAGAALLIVLLAASSHGAATAFPSRNRHRADDRACGSAAVLLVARAASHHHMRRSTDRAACLARGCAGRAYRWRGADWPPRPKGPNYDEPIDCNYLCMHFRDEFGLDTLGWVSHCVAFGNGGGRQPWCSNGQPLVRPDPAYEPALSTTVDPALSPLKFLSRRSIAFQSGRLLTEWSLP